MTTIDANQFLLSTGVPSAKFPTIGTVVKGQVLDFRVEQARDFDTKALRTWDDGNPVMQLVVTLQTDQRDPDRDSDDGARAVYALGGMLKAIRDAVRPHGGIEAGGTLAVQYIGDGEPSRRGLNPPKQYRAEYQPPVKRANLDDIADSDTPLI